MSTTTGIALITGSAQGLGRSIALRLASDGFDIALNDVSSKGDALHAVADEVEKTGRRTQLVLADITIEEEVKEMVQEVSKVLGSLDVMVANAGLAGLSSLVGTDLAEWERIMAVNARGTFLCYKYAAQQMIKQGRGGRIIGAGSIAGESALALAAPYCASKFAVRGLTQTAALELGQHNITVNAYAPGLIDTPMTRTLLADVTEEDRDLFNLTMNRLSMKVVQQEGTPEDVASIVSYLASKESRFITGQCITVDGGILLS